MKKKIVIGVIIATLVVGGSFFIKNRNSKEVKLDPDNPVVLTVWHYYNGAQQQIFDTLVDEFNESVGLEKGIIIEAHSKGSVGDLSQSVTDSVNQEVGAEAMPDIFASYADNAYEIDKLGYVANLSDYLTDDEIDQYMDSYVEEGYLQEGQFKVFPIAKSTETLLLNETDFEQFAKETNTDTSELLTWEGLAKVAEKYYNWTDAQTPDVENDGKAFFGRDAFANYMIIGSKQLGAEMFEVQDGNVTLNVNEEVMRRLWDCFYVPYVNGWYGSYGKFRSDDIKTGQIIALVGSTSGAVYFPDVVTCDDGTTYPIECGVYPLPNFEGTEPYAVQQGAGFVVTKSTKEREYASTVFLKWITQDENNIQLSVNSGYLPVTKSSNDINVLNKYMEELDVNSIVKDIITEGVETTTQYTLYTTKPFDNGYTARNKVEYSMVDTAKSAVEKRDELIESGVSREEAIVQLTSDEAFESWYNEFKEALENICE